MPLLKKSSLKTKLKSKTSFISPLLTANVINQVQNDYKDNCTSKIHKESDLENLSDLHDIYPKISKSNVNEGSSILFGSSDESVREDSKNKMTEINISNPTCRDMSNVTVYDDSASSQFTELLDHYVKTNMQLSQKYFTPDNINKIDSEVVNNDGKSDNTDLGSVLDEIVKLNEALSQTKINDSHLYNREESITNSKKKNAKSCNTKKETNDANINKNKNRMSNEVSTKKNKRNDYLKAYKSSSITKNCLISYTDKKHSGKSIIKKRTVKKNISNAKINHNKNNIGEKKYLKTLKNTMGTDKQPNNRTEIKNTNSISHNQKPTVEELNELLELQKTRDVGLYVYCDMCNKVRYLPNCKDPLELPNKWYCQMNSDLNYNKCSNPNYYIDSETEDLLIYNTYNAGSLVWAKMEGYPWWPAMVDDDPDLKVYFWLDDEETKVPSWYHVTFFDSLDVTRAWIKTSNLEPFLVNGINKMRKTKKCNGYKYRLDYAIHEAIKASKLMILERLPQFSFIQRYLKKHNKMEKIKGKSKTNKNAAIKRPKSTSSSEGPVN